MLYYHLFIYTLHLWSSVTWLFINIFYISLLASSLQVTHRIHNWGPTFLNKWNHFHKHRFESDSNSQLKHSRTLNVIICATVSLNCIHLCQWYVHAGAHAHLCDYVFFMNILNNKHIIAKSANDLADTA